MSHQILRSDDLAAERAAALRDWRRIVGSRFAECRVLSVGVFHGPWPVNRAAQGLDNHRLPPLRGLQWVGDAYKPAGFMMAEGVAESARRLGFLVGSFS
jgi:hypothetical protein